MAIRLKEGAIPTYGGSYLLSKLEEGELKLWIDDQLAKGNI